jgi:hypothetical protein
MTPATAATHDRDIEAGDQFCEAHVTRPEPVVIAAVVQLALAVLVTVGWVVLDDAALATAASVIAAMITALITRHTRAQVTPVDNPVSADGQQLMPESVVTTQVHARVRAERAAFGDKTLHPGGRHALRDEEGMGVPADPRGTAWPDPGGSLPGGRAT